MNINDAPKATFRQNMVTIMVVCVAATRLTWWMLTSKEFRDMWGKRK